MAEYRQDEYWDGSLVNVCITQADTFWKASFFVGSISLFFGVPLVLLVGLYTVIARHLMVYPGIMASHQQQSHQQHGPATQQLQGSNGGPNQNVTPSAIKYRKQVVMMLGTVVLSFFICLLPFRAFTLWIIIVPPEVVMALGVDGYYSLLYFCRIMFNLNSAINPILYNLMSSKFRDGFMRLCGIKKCKKNLRRKGTFNTTTSTTTCSSSQNNRTSPDAFWRRSVTSGRGSLGGDSLRAVLQRKSSTASSEEPSCGSTSKSSLRRTDTLGHTKAASVSVAAPLLNGVTASGNTAPAPAPGPVPSTPQRQLMEDVLGIQRRLRIPHDLDESFV